MQHALEHAGKSRRYPKIKLATVRPRFWLTISMPGLPTPEDAAESILGPCEVSRHQKPATSETHLVKDHI